MNEKSSQEDFEAGLAAANIGDFVLAFQKWMPLAQEGLAKAQCNIGTMFGAGNGVDQDFDEALIWYKLAADQGHVGGQTNLGALYANGQGVDQDLDKAKKLFSLAADQGDVSAQSFLEQLSTERDKLDEWATMLHDNAWIDGDDDNFSSYKSMIAQDMQGNERGRDLGTAMFISNGIQNADYVDADIDRANTISAEANNRMLAHLIHLKDHHQFNFIDKSIQENPIPKLIEMAQTVVNDFMNIEDEATEAQLTDIGIKGVEFIAKEILD